MIYIYQNPNTGKIKEVIQRMNDPHIYEEDGIKWRRVFTLPQISMDTQGDPYDYKTFKRATDDKNLTVGDLIDKSRELSEKRGGDKSDPIKRKNYDNYKKKNGVPHPEDKLVESQNSPLFTLTD